MARNALAIVLSVSGETEEILRFASQFSLHNCKVLSVTSHEHSRLAKMADFNLSGTFHKRALPEYTILPRKSRYLYSGITWSQAGEKNSVKNNLFLM